MAFQAAKCPACGADIQVPADRDTIKCMYCGKDIIVRDAVRAVPGPSVQSLMQLAAAAEVSQNHEEAYVYFTRVLELDPSNADAWFGKGVAAGKGSTLNRSRYPELLTGIERAIELVTCSRSSDQSEQQTCL